MGRHRNVNGTDFKPVADYEVAPHRYLWSGHDESYLEAKSLKDFKEGAPYKAGEVIYIDTGEAEPRLAIVDYVFRDYDHIGFPREKYRVHLAKKDGKAFSRSWVYMWPGMVQRGYQKAGLAPDVPVEK